MVTAIDYHAEQKIYGKSNGQPLKVERFAESCFLSVPFSHESKLSVPLDALIDVGGEPQPTERFHLTLLVAERCSDEQLATFMANISPTMRFSVEVTGFDILDGHEGPVLIWKIDPGPSLSRLQQELYNTASNEGMVVSPYSAPGSWIPHITIADSDCRPSAGHLYSAKVAVTGEFLVTSTGVEVVRKPDDETGLNLLEL